MTDTGPGDGPAEGTTETVGRAAADTPPDAASPLHDPVADGPSPAAPRSAAAKPGSARRGLAIFLGLLLGGAAAAALGFGAARLVPQGWPLAVGTAVVVDTDALESRLAALESEVGTIAARAPAVASPDPRLDGVSAEIAELRAALADRPVPVAVPDLAVTSRLDALDQRLAAIEQAPQMPGGGVAPAALAALQAELARLRDGAASGASEAARPIVAEVQAAAEAVEERLAEAEARARALTEATEAATQATARTAVLSRLRTAVDDGVPFDAALSDLSSAGTSVPETLTAAAAAGVSSRAALQDGFPSAARAALEASRQADMGDTFGARLGSFLQDQTSARSLEPREGTDPDAVLSRAEAALRSGDLIATLAELQGLPPEGQAAMADWTARAQARIAVQDAVAALTAQAGN